MVVGVCIQNSCILCERRLQGRGAKRLTAALGRGRVETRWIGSQRCSFRAVRRHRGPTTAIPLVIGTEGLSGAVQRRFLPLDGDIIFGLPA